MATLGYGKCSKCGSSIPAKATLAQGRLWHVECFVCTNCQREISREYQEKDRHPYCTGCYAELFNPKCKACTQVLYDNCIMAMNESWHHNCFVCVQCRRPFQDGNYYIVDGLPFCLDDHWAKRLDKLRLEQGQQGPPSQITMVDGPGGPAPEPLPASYTAQVATARGVTTMGQPGSAMGMPPSAGLAPAPGSQRSSRQGSQRNSRQFDGAAPPLSYTAMPPAASALGAPPSAQRTPSQQGSVGSKRTGSQQDARTQLTPSQQQLVMQREASQRGASQQGSYKIQVVDPNTGAVIQARST